MRNAHAHPTDTCLVPSCPCPKGGEDCCAVHSARQPRPGCLPNDGVIDWTAIQIAVEGSREVSLTWVEKDISAAAMLARGHSLREVGARLGVYAKDRRRLATLRKMAAVIQEEGLSCA